MDPKLWVAVIEWGPEEGDEEVVVYLATTKRGVMLEAIQRLIVTWQQAPGMFHDDAPEFMREYGRLDYYGTSFANLADDFLEQWLTEFREATTAPWVTLMEKEVSL